MRKMLLTKDKKIIEYCLSKLKNFVNDKYNI